MPVSIPEVPLTLRLGPAMPPASNPASSHAAEIEAEAVCLAADSNALDAETAAKPQQADAYGVSAALLSGLSLHAAEGQTGAGRAADARGAAPAEASASPAAPPLSAPLHSAASSAAKPSAMPSLPGLPALSSSPSPPLLSDGPSSSSTSSSPPPDAAAAPPLPADLDPARLPGHVAIILDGNSRWAAARGLPQAAGHEAGVKAFREAVRLAGAWGIRALTVFAFSTENWGRPKAEVDFLMSLLQRMLEEEAEELHRQGVAVRVVGDLRRLSPALQASISSLHAKTERNAALKLSIAVSYSGRQDIVVACQRIAAQAAAGELLPAAVTEDLLAAQLGTAWLGEGLRDPDLLIRTSGEHRISNFLLWQLAYAEMHFCAALWPEFGAEQLHAALRDYQQRDRRFGKRQGQQG